MRYANYALETGREIMGIIGLNMILSKGKYLRYKRHAVINKSKPYEIMIEKKNLPYKMTSAVVDSLTVKTDY